MKRFLSAAAAAILLFSILSGCNGSSGFSSRNGTAPTGTADSVKVTVTLFGFWSDNTSDIARNLQKALSLRYPDITLEYEAFPTGAAPYMDELNRRLVRGREADLFMTADTSLCGSGKLLDLTKQEFSGRYSIAIMQEISGDGSVWMLPGIGSVLCYAYDTEQYVLPPQTLSELERMTAGLNASGGHAFIVPYEQTPSLMIHALAAGYLASPAGQLWLENYNRGNASMAGNPAMEEVWRMAQRMIDSGVLRQDDMVFAESRRVIRLSEGLGAMSTVSSALVDTLLAAGNHGRSFSLIPLAGETLNDKTLFCSPTFYIAASARLGQAGNGKQRDAAMKVLDFISTREGQDILRGGSPLANSYLRDVEFVLDTRYHDVSEALRIGAYGSVSVFGRGVEAAAGNAFGKMLRGEMTAAQAVAACDAVNASFVDASAIQASPKVIGTALEEFPWTFRSSRTRELAVTNFAADSMRAAGGTDMALELGTAVRGEFFKGQITLDDVASVIRSDKRLYNAHVTGKQLWNIIEQGIKTQNSSWFIAVSGLRYNYQLASEQMNDGKLLSLESADGTPIEMDGLYTVTVSENQMLEFKDLYNFFGSPAEELPVSLREAVVRNIQDKSEIRPVLDGRIEIAE